MSFFNLAGPNYTLMFTKLFCITLALQISLNFKAQLRYFQTEPRKIYGAPLTLLDILKLPELNTVQFISSGLGLICCLLLAAAGVVTRLFIGIAIPLYFLYFNQIISLAYVQRKTNILPLVLLILLVSPSVTLPLGNMASVKWPIILIEACIAQLYLSSGVQKLKQSGLGWCNGETLQAHLFANYLWSDRKTGFIIAQKRWLCTLLSIFTMLFELSFWLILFFPQLTYIYVSAALLFHLGTLLTMRINYLKYLLPVYMVFFTQFAFSLQHNLWP